MTDIRLNLPTVFILVAVVGAGAFAAGQSVSSGASSSLTSLPSSPPARPTEVTDPQNDTPELPVENDEPLPPGHPPTTGPGAVGAAQLPIGHPPTDRMGPGPAQMVASEPPPESQAPLEWKVAARWKVVPNPSAFRLATCRVPHAQGDAEDAELSVTRAGGSVEANAERWIGQFDAADQLKAKRTKRMVGPLEVTIVEVQGNYSGGMGKDAPSSGAGWALLGAIVATPGAAHFFKLTGPAKTVLAARGEFDAMVASLVQR
jgi:hypothetical protein